MENIVTVVFEVESEAYKAFSEIKQAPKGTDYGVAEAALLKNEDDSIKLVDAFDAAAITSDDTSIGIIVGSIAGIMGGPLGVLLGASYGALVGATVDAMDTNDSLSMMEVLAEKLYEGETAIVALVQEEEPAFDTAFEGYATTIIRHDVVDVAEELDAARNAEKDMQNQLRAQLRADRKAERADKRAEREAKVKARFEEFKAKHA